MLQFVNKYFIKKAVGKHMRMK